MRRSSLLVAILTFSLAAGCWRPYYGANYAPPVYQQQAPAFQAAPIVQQPPPVMQQPIVQTTPVYQQPVYQQPMMQNGCVPASYNQCVPCY